MVTIERGVLESLLVCMGSSVSIWAMASSVELVGAPMEITSAMRMARSMVLEGEPQETSDVSDLALEALWRIALIGLLRLGMRLCLIARRSSCLRSSLWSSFSVQRPALKSAISYLSLAWRVDLMCHRLCPRHQTFEVLSRKSYK